MDVSGEQQHSSPWLRPDAPRVGNYDTAGILPSEDMADMFSPHFIDSNAGHMNAAGYYANQARAAMSYRPSHGKKY